MRFSRYRIAHWIHGNFYRASSRWRVPLLALVYSAGLAGSLCLAYELRFDFAVPVTERPSLWRNLVWMLPLKLALLALVGQFGRMLSYFSIPDLRRLALAMLSATAVVALVWSLSGGPAAPPRSVIAGDFVLSFVVLCGTRLVFRRVRETFVENRDAVARRLVRVGIVGAGDAGAALARELLAKSRHGLLPVVFLDDDPQKWDSRLHGIPVIGPPEMLPKEAARYAVEKVIIAMPSASGKRVQEVVRVLQGAQLPFETVPSLGQLASGQVKVTQIRPVEIEDLLGREPVQLETASIRQLLAGKAVLVTGAGGSIGSELCRQIMSYGPARLLMLEQSEYAVFRIEQELLGRGGGQAVVPLIGNILDAARLRGIFEQYGPHLVFHAAAHKHVPLMETHPVEAVKNNTFGTMQVASFAREYGAERFVFVSTDKAINPTSVMGASKRLAEMFLQSFSANRLPVPPPDGTGHDWRLASLATRNGHDGTKFMAVRFGNVLGSSGSVIPTFKEQIAAGGPVTVTHPEVTRYFMTIPEAVGLVLQSATQGNGGEIFVLDMGKPVRIADLARQLIELSGLRPGHDIEIRFVGLRPGEKLYEELSYRGEHLLPTSHSKIMRFVSRPTPFALIQHQLLQLEERLPERDLLVWRALLRGLVPEYRPESAPTAPSSHLRVVA